MTSKPAKVLIFRFSSFGDVLQSLSVVGKISEEWPLAEIDFCTRSDFVSLIENHPNVRRVWSIDRKAGLSNLLKLSLQLSKENWTHIYDSHNNLRSRIICWNLNGLLGLRRLLKGHSFVRRPLYRWKRFLLFKFKKNLFPKPFSGQKALLDPLKHWGINSELPKIPQLIFSSAVIEKMSDVVQAWGQYIALAPSAAYPLKRWPLDYFIKLMEQLPHSKFVILGGPEDDFLSSLESVGQARIINVSGKYSIEESGYIVASSQALVANDTGLMHVAEQTGVPCVALMGPAPFGFPSRPKTRVLERNLKCRPCSKHGQGPCVNKSTYQKCLVDIKPEEVVNALKVMDGVQL